MFFDSLTRGAPVPGGAPCQAVPTTHLGPYIVYGAHTDDFLLVFFRRACYTKLTFTAEGGRTMGWMNINIMVEQGNVLASQGISAPFFVLAAAFLRAFSSKSIKF